MPTEGTPELRLDDRTIRSYELESSWSWRNVQASYVWACS